MIASNGQWQRLILPCLALLYMLLITGCEVESLKHPNTTIQPTFYSIQQQILTLNCTSSSCHSKSGRRGNLVLTSDVAYENLVSVLSENSAAQARGLVRVDPGKPDSSFLLIKLTSPGPDEGDRMPQSNGSIGTEAIDAIRTWIANGAKRD